jgi:hypothetical protein
MQRRAVADLEIDGDALRALGAVDKHGGVALQHRVVDRLASLFGDGAQATEDTAGTLVLANEMAGERQHLEGEAVVLGVSRFLHIAGLNQRHQHAVGSRAVHTDAQRDFSHRHRAALLADEVEHGERLECGGTDVGVEVAHPVRAKFVQYSYSRLEFSRQVQISLTCFYF